MRRVRVKICCIQNAEEAALAIDAGADAIGLVSAMPSGPGPISEDEIGAISDHTPPGISRFLLTCLQDAEAIVAQHVRCRTDTIQLCDELAPGAYAELRGRLPGVRLVQVIHVAGEESVQEALAAAPHVHALLLDSGRPKAAVKELGGTGRVHDWKVSRAICEQSPVPVYLAGGLNPENAAEAIRAARPFGLDVCSGLRTDDRLDEEKVRTFLKVVRDTAL